MFTRLSRLHPNLQILMVAIGCLLIWADGFPGMHLPLQGTDLSPMYGWCFGWSFNSGLLSTLVAFALVMCTVLIWHFILVEEGLLPRNNVVPMLVSMLLLTYCPVMMQLSPVLPANLLLILSIRMMMKMRYREKAYQDIFTAGLLLSLATLFNPYHVFFIPLLWFALILFRTGSFREWVICLLGILAPAFYLLFIIFWNNQLRETAAVYQNFFRTFRFLNGFEAPQFMIYIIMGSMCLLFLPAFYRFVSRMNEKLIALRKSSTLLIWMFFLSLLMLPVLQADLLVEGSPLLLSMSVIISSYMISVKKKRIPEILLALITASIIAGKFLL